MQVQDKEKKTVLKRCMDIFFKVVDLLVRL